MVQLKGGTGFISMLLIIVLPMGLKGQSLFDIYSRPSKLISSNYSISLFDVTLVVNSNSGNDTLTLPAGAQAYSSANQTGLIYHIKNIGVNNVYLRVFPSSGDSIESSISIYLISPSMTSREVQPATIHSWFVH